MQVDFREKYIIRSVEKRDIKKLSYGWQFFKGNEEKIIQNYSYAKNEVENWLSSFNKGKLYTFLNNLKNGRSFEALYVERGTLKN